MRDGEDRITMILERLSSEGHVAYDQLMPLVYDELHELARSIRRRSSPGSTLETTALVHEAYLRLARHAGGRFEHRGHFFAVAAAAMRQLLVDAARRRNRKKRGEGVPAAAVDLDSLPVDDQAELVLAVDEALTRLEGLNPRLRRVVECRFFAGLTEQQTAEALDVTERTVRRDWVKARGWLQLALAPPA